MMEKKKYIAPAMNMMMIGFTSMLMLSGEKMPGDGTNPGGSPMHNTPTRKVSALYV